MRKNVAIARGFEVVTFLFAGFGGYLRTISPPENEHARFAVGFSSFLTLIVFLLISALTQEKQVGKQRRRWLAVAFIFFILIPVCGLAYWRSLQKLTFIWEDPPHSATFYAGLEALPGPARKQILENLSNVELLARYGGPKFINDVWSEDSRNNAQLLILSEYIALVLCIAIEIFCLTEALFVTTNQQYKKKSARS